MTDRLTLSFLFKIFSCHLLSLLESSCNILAGVRCFYRFSQPVNRRKFPSGASNDHFLLIFGASCNDFPGIGACLPKDPGLALWFDIAPGSSQEPILVAKLSLGACTPSFMTPIIKTEKQGNSSPLPTFFASDPLTPDSRFALARTQGITLPNNGRIHFFTQVDTWISMLQWFHPGCLVGISLPSLDGGACSKKCHLHPGRQSSGPSAEPAAGK